MILKKKAAIIYHIFYEDTFEDIVNSLKGFDSVNTAFLFNISSAAPNQSEIRETLHKHFPGSFITISSNKGKDIGGKLVLINACIQLNIEPEWFIFLHDKKSLQALNSKTWKNDLLKIIAEDEIKNVDAIISSNLVCGIIASGNYIANELSENGVFVGNNGSILTQLIKQYKISCTNYEYVAGTMFWAKASPLMEFFKKNDPLKIRQTLEAGNVIDNFAGTYTHSWERLLSWIITSQGLTIKKI
jgi:lipopolysaccharide biosynthesis protein